MPTLTFGMIVKNEEKNLPACLASIKDIADEIIIVDTGSTDKTVEIAETFGAKIIHHTWDDNMAAARDEYLKASTKEWILCLDADERISESDAPRIKELIESHPQAHGFLLTKRDYGYPGTQRPSDDPYPESEGFASWMPVKELRLFRNDKRLRYTHYVHTTLIPSFEQYELPVVDAPAIPIHHFRGTLTPAQKKAKRENYIRMLTKETKEHPEDPSAWGHLADEIGDTNPAAMLDALMRGSDAIRQLLREGKKTSSYHAAILERLAKIQSAHGMPETALATCILAAHIGSTNPLIHATIGDEAYVHGQLADAREHYRKARACHHPHKDAIDARLNEIAKKLGLVEQYF